MPRRERKPKKSPAVKAGLKTRAKLKKPASSRGETGILQRIEDLGPVI